MTKNLVMVFMFLLISGLQGGCSGEPNADKTITVSAAASMKDVLGEIKQQFEKDNPGTKVSFNFGSSGTLQQQIEQGAPVDIFISAGKKQISALEAKGLINKPRIVAGNKLVVTVPAGKGLEMTSLMELMRERYTKIAMGNPETVPAGKYSEEALQNSGIMEQIRPKLILAKDVRQVLTYIETAETEAGLVYMTDAKVSDKVDIVFVVPAELHSPIVYPAVVVKISRNPEQAEEFLNFMGSESAKLVLGKYGFVLP